MIKTFVSSLTFVAVSSILFFTCGPVLSKNPLFKESETTYDARLLGTWISVGTAVKDTLEVRRLGEKVYEAIFTEKGTSTVFVIDLGKLGAQMFLDAELARTSLDPQWASHSFYKVDIGKDKLTIAHLEEDWLKKMADGKKLNISHKLSVGKLILIAPTDSLQKFVMKYAQNKEAFPRPATFVLKK
jgi:hypothetical protein